MLDSANFAVIFVSQRTDQDPDGYAAMSDRMEALARRQEGFVDIHSVRDETGKGITVSYWSSMDAIRQWAMHGEHLGAQRTGRDLWYQAFEIAVACDLEFSTPQCAPQSVRDTERI